MQGVSTNYLKGANKFLTCNYDNIQNIASDIEKQNFVPSSEVIILLKHEKSP